MSPEVIELWLKSHVAYIDRDVPWERRQAAARPYVEALSKAAPSTHELARALAYGYEDTKFAVHVLEGHCERMPRGERCDRGRARGPFSLHFRACRAAYFFRAGTEDSALVETVCALGLLRQYAAHCADAGIGADQAAFAGMATGGGCYYSKADERAKRTLEVETQLVEIERGLQSESR